MDLGDKISGIEKEVRMIREYLNDTSHRVEKMEKDIEWIKMLLKWGFAFLAFLIGMSIGL